MLSEQIDAFLEQFAAWAQAQPDIQAVALVGSHARNAATGASDIDLVVIATRPEVYLRSTEWTERFGAVQKQQVEDYGALVSLRVWYGDGREVEYGLTSERWTALPLDNGTHRVISDGMRILFERRPILSTHLRGS